MKKVFLEAEDFNNRLNMNFFTNVEKGVSETELEKAYPSEFYMKFEKSSVEDWIKETYRATGGEIVKGGFNDTEEVSEILSKMKREINLMKSFQVKNENDLEGRTVYILDKARTNRVVGETRTNPITGKNEVWTQLSSGKSDWRAVKGSSKKEPKKRLSDEGKTKEEHDAEALKSRKLYEEAANRYREMMMKNGGTEPAGDGSEANKHFRDFERHQNKSASLERNKKIQKSKEPEILEKGELDNLVNYSDLKISFKKTGKEIKEKLALIEAKENLKLASIKAKMENISCDAEHKPTEKYSSSDSDDMPLCYKYDMTYVKSSEDSYSKGVIKINDETQACLTSDQCCRYREWNDLCYSYRDSYRELKTIELLKNNLEEDSVVELNARQMLSLGF